MQNNHDEWNKIEINVSAQRNAEGYFNASALYMGDKIEVHSRNQKRAMAFALEEIVKRLKFLADKESRTLPATTPIPIVEFIRKHNKQNTTFDPTFTGHQYVDVLEFNEESIKIGIDTLNARWTTNQSQKLLEMLRERFGFKGKIEFVAITKQ